MPHRDPEKHKAWCREYYRKNAERMKAAAKAWREAHPEKMAEYGAAFRARNPGYSTERARAWAERNPDKVKTRHRAKTLAQYGLTPEDYDRMLAAQGGRCAICGTDNPGGQGNRLHVDHDHETGRVRGLLCQGCNARLGWFEPRQAQVMNYLLEHAGVVQ